VRSRPKVSLYYSEKVATAGRPFTIELALVGKTVTPVDFIETKLVGTESVTVGEGKGQYSRSIEVLRWSAREAPGVIEPREYRYRYTFEIPEAASASYRGTRAWVTYAMSVHVSVPWWPDRSAQYTLPVVVPDAAAPEDRPVIRASADGPQPGKVYAEVSIDHDVLGPGGIIAGAVSVSNTAAHRVRRVVASLVARETIHSPELVSYVVDRHTVILVDGAPGEGEAVPFRMRLPEGVVRTFAARTFELEWNLTVRVVVAFAEDAIVVIPLSIVPGAPAALRPGGRYHPVGRDRFAQVWTSVAAKLGMTLDDDGRTLRMSSERASVIVRGTYDGKAYALRVELAWPTLGIDLHVTARSWADLVTAAWIPPSAKAREKLVIRAREPEQLAALFDAPLLDVLAAYTGVSMDDHHATLSLPVPGTNAAELEQACVSALGLLARVVRWPTLVPPPRTMSSALDAWREFARRTSGTLEVGSLSATDCSLGVDRFSIETFWIGTDQPLATVVTFPLDPPLDAYPGEDAVASSDAPLRLVSLTDEASTVYDAVRTVAPNLEVTRSRVSWRAPGAVPDPAVLLPSLELTARLVRALRHRATLGPYR